jgi:hypothetical protein
MNGAFTAPAPRTLEDAPVVEDRIATGLHGVPVTLWRKHQQRDQAGRKRDGTDLGYVPPVPNFLPLPQKTLNLRPIRTQKIEKALPDSIRGVRSPGKNDVDLATPVTHCLEYNVPGMKMLYAGR